MIVMEGDSMHDLICGKGEPTFNIMAEEEAADEVEEHQKYLEKAKQEIDERMELFRAKAEEMKEKESMVKIIKQMQESAQASSDRIDTIANNTLQLS